MLHFVCYQNDSVFESKGWTYYVLPNAQTIAQTISNFISLQNWDSIGFSTNLQTNFLTSQIEGLAGDIKFSQIIQSGN